MKTPTPRPTAPGRETSEGAAICALASGSGAAAVGLIRLSGHGCHQLLAPLLKRPRQAQPAPTLADWPVRELRLCHVVDPELSGPQAVIDEAMVVLFRAPKSYTGEESAEIHAHGGPYVVQRLLTLLYRHGFRAAEPGEFTRRAFLQGKLDLTAAEGIKELAQAQTHQQWIAARHLADGRLKEAIEGLRHELVGALAYLEAQIDFPDEGDTAHLHLGHVRRRVVDTMTHLKRLMGSYANGRVASQGLMVALYGAPNAGKSTLMNTLLGRERALVTEVPGTTRDYLEERCLVHGRLIRLVDLAGVRDTTDHVEALGVAAAQRLAREADLVLILAAADQPGATDVATWQAELTGIDVLKLLTKTDLGEPVWAKDWQRLSCRTGTGVDELVNLLAERVDRHVHGLDSEPAFVTSARQMAALTDAMTALTAFVAADQAGSGEELLAFELQDAAKALRGIIGDVSNDDLLDQIFRDFCIGK